MADQEKIPPTTINELLAGVTFPHTLSDEDMLHVAMGNFGVFKKPSASAETSPPASGEHSAASQGPRRGRETLFGNLRQRLPGLGSRRAS